MGWKMKARSSEVATRAQWAGTQRSAGWEALRTNAIGSLWGRSVAEPDVVRTQMSR